ncbi:hypothetical protein IF650_16120 [Cellulosimicrobium terreum]|nr:hypothetical protein [Cellulosimicrobium terreum]
MVVADVRSLVLAAADDAAQSFPQSVALAVLGPVLTTALALGVATFVTQRAQARREVASLRETLAQEMASTANTLYLALQAFWRAAHGVPLADRQTAPELKERREQLEAVYLDMRAHGQVIENRLSIYFASDEPRAAWHAVTDLLTVRYFLLLLGDGARRRAIRERNAGPEHSGLSAPKLKDPAALLDAYRVGLDRCVELLWQHRPDQSGRHVATGGLSARRRRDRVTTGRHGG